MTIKDRKRNTRQEECPDSGKKKKVKTVNDDQTAVQTDSSPNGDGNVLGKTDKKSKEYKNPFSVSAERGHPLEKDASPDQSDEIMDKEQARLVKKARKLARRAERRAASSEESSEKKAFAYLKVRNTPSPTNLLVRLFPTESQRKTREEIFFLNLFFGNLTFSSRALTLMCATRRNEEVWMPS